MRYLRRTLTLLSLDLAHAKSIAGQSPRVGAATESAYAYERAREHRRNGRQGHQLDPDIQPRRHQRLEGGPINGSTNFIMKPFHIPVSIINLIVFEISYNSPNLVNRK